jgi:uncharacterized protein (TIGR02145 family)
MQPLHSCPSSALRHFIFTMAFLLLVSSFSSGQVFYTITDSRDGKEYKVVHIDDLWWMAENLNVGTRIDILLNQGNNGELEKYCYNDKESNCSIYGGLYQWEELMQYGTVEFNQGICPSGWHVSSDNEWKQLEKFLGMSQASVNDTGFRGDKEGGMLKSIGTTYWVSPNSEATNTYGFSALPGGYRDLTGNNYFEGYAAYFWNAETNLGDPYFRALYYLNGRVYRKDTSKGFGASVRCIKDSPYIFSRSTFTDTRDSKVYKTVLIANHWWMAENLNTGIRINHDVEQADNHSIQKYCYNDNEAYCDTFGGLYQWDEAMQYSPEDKQGICPDGWHVPTDEDWMGLEWASGMAEKDINLEGWRNGPGIFLQPEGASGFDALLGGVVVASKTMYDCDTLAYFWTSSEGSDYQSSCMRGIQKDFSTVNRKRNFYKKNAHSLRCVQNDDEVLSLSIEAEDTVCTGMETTLRGRTYGGSKIKNYYWWSEPAGFSAWDSVIQIVPSVNTRYFVRVIDGDVYIRDSVRFSILPAPDNFIITGETSVCPSNEQLGYSITSNSSYNYTWDVSADGVGTLVSSDENHANYSWGTTPGYGYIEVTATNPENGCSAMKTDTIEVMQSPKPEIVLKGNSLLICTDSGQIYQWYHDGNKLNKATKQFYYAKGNATGSYTVEITWDNGCQNVSKEKIFTKKSTADPGFDETQTVFVHPNPTDGNIILDMINDYLGSFEITVSSSNGTIVKQQRLNKFNPVYSTCLELGGLAEGSYIMAVDYGGIREVQRITIKK